VNDQAGHEAGDAVIVQVAMALTEAALPHEDAVVSRMGGDEFCVLLPQGNSDAAQAIAEKAAGRLGGDDAVPVRISCGVADRGEGTERPAELLRAADAAQYSAKHAGPEVSTAVAEPGSGAPSGEGKGRAFRNRSDEASRELARELLELGEQDSASAEEVLERMRRRLAEEGPG
jgi:GGDEF domain-containing protein